ncbi:uncharacterized protein LY89DRAFT_720864 [Mollisia scopiformis]|uniref:Uncharacterized protein n=1 Tax=Mollisia scopiformis TaxID=149040 RepID=A0A194X330_MOLSC|nr:uncharacterized protein LY89DRAFT_720864 [Mollisia scopiformis]KUJ14588.1 hypothetical protein LY89DRAFT_720864 [Mollisia scopiformis]
MTLNSWAERWAETWGLRDNFESTGFKVAAYDIIWTGCNVPGQGDQPYNAGERIRFREYDNEDGTSCTHKMSFQFGTWFGIFKCQASEDFYSYTATLSNFEFLDGNPDLNENLEQIGARDDWFTFEFVDTFDDNGLPFLWWKKFEGSSMIGSTALFGWAKCCMDETVETD